MRHALLSMVVAAAVQGALMAPAWAACLGGSPNRILEAGEQCDDGGAAGNGCCDATCLFVAKGASCRDDWKPCTHNSCNGWGKCEAKKIDGLPEYSCDDPPDLCTEDVCVDGECQRPRKTCADGDPCTEDRCLPSTGECVHTVAADGAACAATPCRGAGQCMAGACVAGPSLPDGSFCWADSCHVGGQCAAGECVPGPPIACTDDGNSCTEDRCDPALGCVHDALPEGSGCEDDQNDCTEDRCDRGHCQHRPGPETGRICYAVSPCQPSGLCASDGTCVLPGCPAPPNPCSTDDRSCEAADPCAPDGGLCRRGACVPRPCPAPCETDGMQCDDYNLCTPASACHDGVCQGEGCLVDAAGVCPCGGVCGDSPCGCRF